MDLPPPTVIHDFRPDLKQTLDEPFHNASPEEKASHLIRIGATYAVWPKGTSFVLTYPWDLLGNERPVRFRNDLTEFMKRRIAGVLKQAGRLRNPNLF
jgi:hypothetical protein